MAAPQSRLARLLRHVFSWPAAASRRFPESTMDRVERRIAEGEQTHSAEIRIAIESCLSAGSIWARQSPRERALEVFGSLGVWDTDANNGVLVYLLLADHAVEIVADRGANASIDARYWREACDTIIAHCRADNDEQGLLDAIDGLNAVLAEAYPAGQNNRDELPNRPTLL